MRHDTIDRLARQIVAEARAQSERALLADADKLKYDEIDDVLDLFVGMDDHNYRLAVNELERILPKQMPPE